MRCVRVVVGAAVAVMLSVALSAQAKPDFTGVWIPVGPGAGPGDALKIKQDATTLSVEDDEHVVRYRLDGTETRTSPTEHSEVVSKASWQGSRLVVVNTFFVDGTKRSVRRQFWSVDPSAQLVIEDTRQAEGVPDATTKSVYKRRGDPSAPGGQA